MFAAIAVALFLSPPPEISAPVALVADLESEEILLMKGKMEPHAIASITKLLALRVVVRAGLDLGGKTTMLASDWAHTKGGARTRLVRGATYENTDLLHAALLGSDNRAVVALGRSAGLNHAELVQAMNTEAKSLGLLGAHFTDVTGISHANRMTPLSIVTLLESTLAAPVIASVSRKNEYETRARERSGRPLVYRNTNLLVRDKTMDVLVGKTGFNSAAGWSVAAIVALSNQRRVAIIVLGTSGKHMRFRDARRLARWVETIPWAPARTNQPETR